MFKTNLPPIIGIYVSEQNSFVKVVVQRLQRKDYVLNIGQTRGCEIAIIKANSARHEYINLFGGASAAHVIFNKRGEHAALSPLGTRSTDITSNSRVSQNPNRHSCFRGANHWREKYAFVTDWRRRTVILIVAYGTRCLFQKLTRVRWFMLERKIWLRRH